MRLAIFTGLLYVAWAINPQYLDSVGWRDVVLINFVFFVSVIYDWMDAFRNLILQGKVTYNINRLTQ